MKGRTWKVERAAAVEFLRWYAIGDAHNGCDHEAQIVARLARRIERGEHVPAPRRKRREMP